VIPRHFNAQDKARIRGLFRSHRVPTGEYMKFRLLVVTLILIIIAGCSKLTMENYNKLKIGMAYKEVVDTIGSPDKCSDVMGLRNCEWGDEKKSINVTFAGDKVLFFTGNGIH
jgi:hypothetical protein